MIGQLSSVTTHKARSGVLPLSPPVKALGTAARGEPDPGLASLGPRGATSLSGPGGIPGEQPIDPALKDRALQRFFGSNIRRGGGGGMGMEGVSRVSPIERPEVFAQRSMDAFEARSRQVDELNRKRLLQKKDYAAALRERDDLVARLNREADELEQYRQENARYL